MSHTATCPSDSRQAPPVGDESARPALDLIHHLLAADACANWALDRVARELAAAFGASGAGLVDLVSGRPIVHCSPGQVDDAVLPWQETPDVLIQVRDAWTAVEVQTALRSWLLAAASAPVGQGGWMVVLHDVVGRVWTAAERAALVLAVQVLARAAGDTGPRWGRQLDRVRRQQRLEDSAQVVQRLTHDYGNFLTTILGFSELGLSLPDPGQPLAGYLHEVHHAALQASQFTDRLRLFSRRGSPGPRSADLAAVAAEVAAHLRPLWGSRVRLDLDLAADLPPLFITSDLLRQVLHELLANAGEAIVEEGQVRITAREVTLDDADGLDYFGRPPAGPSLEVSISDNGSGLSPEARRGILASPFFTTRPRHRGLGLAAVYGILHLHCGGLAFDDRPGGGTVARFVLPIVRSRIADQDQGANAPRSPSSASREKVLVVDDDPMVLRFVSTTLERGGYRVQTAQSGDEALRRYQDSTAEPFRLVLSDVAMPLMNGVDLARRLVQHDAQVNLLFMSGQVSPDFAPENWGGAPFPLLRKPFHPEGLLRAVRAALDCGRPPAASEVDSPAGPAAALTSSP